jgi:hypothetical protein
MFKTKTCIVVYGNNEWICVEDINSKYLIVENALKMPLGEKKTKTYIKLKICASIYKNLKTMLTNENFNGTYTTQQHSQVNTQSHWLWDSRPYKIWGHCGFGKSKFSFALFCKGLSVIHIQNVKGLPKKKYRRNSENNKSMEMEKKEDTKGPTVIRQTKRISQRVTH